MDSTIKPNSVLPLPSSTQPFQPPPSSLQKTEPPPSVQAVLELGYPKGIVLEAYHQLASEGSRRSGPHHAAGPAVTAAMLMTSVDAMLERQEWSGGASLGWLNHQCVFSGENLMSERRTDDEGVEEDGSGDETEDSSSAEAAAAAAATSTVLEAPGRNPNQTHPAATTSSDTNTPQTAQHINEATSTSEILFVPLTSAPAHESHPSTIPVPSSVPVNSPADDQPTAVSFQSAPSAQPPPSSTRSEACSEAGQSSPAKEKKRLARRVRTLREENRRLRARRVCRQCREREVNLTFLPCGHFAYCQQCGSVLNKCPLCSKTILADVKTFLS